jgi:cystathionine beta-lyase family protein involved in aluminum resistance
MKKKIIDFKKAKKEKIAKDIEDDMNSVWGGKEMTLPSDYARLMNEFRKKQVKQSKFKVVKGKKPTKTKTKKKNGN